MTRDEREIPDQEGVDPLLQNLREYLVEGGLLTDEVKALEFSIKAQRLDRRGKVIQGVALESADIATLFDDILDEHGPGRYTLYVRFRPAGSKEWRFLKVTDLAVADGTAPLPPEGVVPGAGPATPGLQGAERRDVFELMLAQMQQTTQMMMAAQENNTKLLVAMLTRGGGSGAGSSDIIRAIQTGAQLAGGRGVGGDGEEEESPVERLIDFGSQVLKLMGEKEDGAVPVADLRGAVTKSGIDPKELLAAQGLEPVGPGE